MTLSANQLAVRSGASYRQIDHWTRRGHLHPWRVEPGSGNYRTFPDSDIRIASALAQLAQVVDPSKVTVVYAAVAEAAAENRTSASFTTPTGTITITWETP